MRLTDNRYASERSQFELALRMIHHEARTRTIKDCTGLSDDPFVKHPLNRLEATTLISLFCASLLLRIDAANRIHACWPRPDVEYGHRVCRAFETYLLLHPRPKLNFEWAWSLLQNISKNDELFLATCAGCRTRYVQDTYALDHKICPGCEISGSRERRPVTAASSKIQAE